MCECALLITFNIEFFNLSSFKGCSHFFFSGANPEIEHVVPECVDVVSCDLKTLLLISPDTRYMVKYDPPVGRSLQGRRAEAGKTWSRLMKIK